MKKKNIKILAIESSCDETAAAVIGDEDGHPVVLSSIVSSQVDLHTKTGGVVPEVASRAHMEAIVPVVSEALINDSSAVIPTKAGIQETICIDSGSQETGRNDNKIGYSKSINILKDEIDYIAVTAGPGLIGSLLVGYNAAKTIAYALGKPIIPINHIEGHIYSAFAEQVPSNEENSVLGEIEFPLISLTVSGGHTSLTLMTGHGEYQNLGSTLDDAAGEAFDKVAKLMDLGYPGGPIISKFASQFRENSKLKIQSIGIDSGSQATGRNDSKGIVFPRPILNDGTFNFSFSGLKTAVLQKVTELKLNNFNECHPDRALRVEGAKISTISGQIREEINQTALTTEQKEEIAAAFEDAAIDVLVTKALRAVEKYQTKTFILAGGVAANKYLREQLTTRLNEKYPDVRLIIPPFSLCGDNAAMIGTAAYYHAKRNDFSTWDKIIVDSGLEL